MEFYSRNIMPFDAYLDIRAGNAANEALAKATSLQIASLSRGFGAVVATQQQMTNLMAEGFGAVTFGLGQVNRSIESLRSDFNWAMGEVLSKLEMQQKALQEIATVLQAPLDTQAKELRRRAEFAYQNGWYQEALADFLQAEKQNYQDFMVHQSIANIYLYHERPANLDLSRDYYLKAAKYSLPVSKYHSALAHMYAGFVCYLQRDNIAAIQNAARATEIYPQLTEAYFNHAKFSASAGQAALAIPSLEFAIRSDRKYALKARADSDFENIEVQVNELMTRLYTETRTLAESKVREIRSNRYLCQITKVKTALSNAEGYLQFNSYFGNLDAITAVASIDESVWLCYQDKYVSITTSSIIVDGQEFSLKKMRPVSTKGSFRGWSGRIVNHIDLVQSDGKKIYQISSEDRKWTEKIVIEINKVINSYR